MPELRLTRRAREQLEAFPTAVREAVVETLVSIQLTPEEMGKRLVGRMAGLWSARVGSYRVLYTVEPTDVIVRSMTHKASRTRRDA